MSALIILLGVVQSIATLSTNRPWAWRTEVLITLTWWAGWLPFVPLVHAVVKRHAFGTGRMLSSALVHGVAAAAISLAHLSLVTLAMGMLGAASAKSVSWLALLSTFLGVPFLVFDVATYGGVAAALLAAAYARAYREEELLAEQLRASSAALEASVAQARLDVLRMELNPHFLFNALNAVSGLIGRNRVPEAQETIGRLGALLRQTLQHNRSHFTAVSSELDLARDFLYIEQARFGDRLSVRIVVDDAALDAAIPTMLLQPLIENAVRHGVEPMLQRGEIAILIRRDGRDLLVCVEDSGRGFALTGNLLGHDGIGLSNTHARLQQLFGANARLTMTNRLSGGARVEVRMPWRRAGDSSAASSQPIDERANAPR